jgi:hypothetical protein
MNSDVMSYIKDLKNKLFSLEENYCKRMKVLENREHAESRLDQKIKDLVELQKEILTFNIGGEKVNVSRNLIESCIYDNILKDVIENLLDIGRSSKDVENVFIDRSAKTFYYIVELIRKSKLIHQNKEAKLIIPNAYDAKVFLNEVQFYFKQDAERVLEDIVIGYQTEKGVVYLNQNISIIESCKVSTVLPNEMLDPYRASIYDDIRKKSSNKAFFVSYDSEFVVNLTHSTKLNSIEVKPFTFDLDSWYPGEGAGAFIFTSNDGNEYDFLAAIPDDYGSDLQVVYRIDFDPRVAKYIKFQTGDFTLSICYLKIS